MIARILLVTMSVCVWCFAATAAFPDRLAATAARSLSYQPGAAASVAQAHRNIGDAQALIIRLGKTEGILPSRQAAFGGVVFGGGTATGHATGSAQGALNDHERFAAQWGRS